MKPDAVASGVPEVYSKRPPGSSTRLFADHARAMHGLGPAEPIGDLPGPAQQLHRLAAGIGDLDTIGPDELAASRVPTGPPGRRRAPRRGCRGWWRCSRPSLPWRPCPPCGHQTSASRICHAAWRRHRQWLRIAAVATPAPTSTAAAAAVEGTAHRGPPHRARQAGGEQRVDPGIDRRQADEGRDQRRRLRQERAAGIDEHRHEGDEEGDALRVERGHHIGVAHRPPRTDRRGRGGFDRGAPQLHAEPHQIRRAGEFQHHEQRRRGGQQRPQPGQRQASSR